MYLQNTLSTIEHRILNEIKYSLAFKQIVAKQIARLDLTQQTFFEDLKAAFGQGASTSASAEEAAVG